MGRVYATGAQQVITIRSLSKKFNCVSAVIAFPPSHCWMGLWIATITTRVACVWNNQMVWSCIHQILSAAGRAADRRGSTGAADYTNQGPLALDLPLDLYLTAAEGGICFYVSFTVSCLKFGVCLLFYLFLCILHFIHLRTLRLFASMISQSGRWTALWCCRFGPHAVVTVTTLHWELLDTDCGL